MTTLERLAAEKAMLVEAVETVLEAEGSLDWYATPARPLVVKVQRVARDSFSRLFCDDYVKKTINEVVASKRKEARLQRKQVALRA